MNIIFSPLSFIIIYCKGVFTRRVEYCFLPRIRLILRAYNPFETNCAYSFFFFMHRQTVLLHAHYIIVLYSRKPQNNNNTHPQIIPFFRERERERKTNHSMLYNMYITTCIILYCYVCTIGRWSHRPDVESFRRHQRLERPRRHAK